jgi:hypothetical protein
MKIEIIIDVLDELEPDSLFSLSETPTDQASFESAAKCSKDGLIDTDISVKWSDVEAKYKEHEGKFAMNEMRKKRDELLKESDVEVLSDRTPSDEMKAYRQALRDLPVNENPTYDADGNLIVNWPTKP